MQNITSVHEVNHFRVVTSGRCPSVHYAQAKCSAKGLPDSLNSPLQAKSFQGEKNMVPYERVR